VCNGFALEGEEDMLTIKHVEESGHQSVTSAASVTFTPANLTHPDDQNGHDEVIAFGVPMPISDGCNRYRNGTVYVMNDHGSTVANYNLD
jgi:hypothetical protein